MSLVESLKMKLFLPLNCRHSTFRAGKMLSSLQKSEWFDKSTLETIQASKIASLIESTRKNVPFYKDYNAWKEEGRSLREQLATYPILTKDAIRGCPSAMRRNKESQERSHKCTTGGTTGKPIDVWRDVHYAAMVDAAYWRGMGWIGIKPWTRGVTAHGFGRGSWYGRLRLRLTNKMVIDGFGKNDIEKRLIVRLLRKFKPSFITGYVSEILSIGKHCFDEQVKIETVLTTGEMLYDHQRDEIERLYRAKVSNYYGCNEVGSLAFECEWNNKHITDEHVIIEVVDDADNPVYEQSGRVLLTDLDNFLTPFIRYEVGDLGVLTKDKCPCGRNLTLLKSIEGRTQDVLVNNSGGRLGSLFFAGRFRDLKSIQRIQFVQRSITEVDLLYEGSMAGIETEIDTIVQEIKNRLGSQMVVKPEPVEGRILTGRGKYRLIIPLGFAEHVS